jgi:uncharacterized iron-regulated membrane protein
MTFKRVNRLVHRWATPVVAIPSIIILVTGVMLQLKKQSDWIQPPTRYGSGSIPVIDFGEILEVVRSVDEAGITSWDDVDRVDIRPSKGVIKVRSVTRWEVQIDGVTGSVLHSAYRRSDLIESLHDGSFFHDAVKLWVYLPAALVLTVMWATGLYLFVLPSLARRRRPARRTSRASG